ncbi:hypothetical protein XBI1_2450013 [Xenorhabdus bovienii str. Intermedium]|uniref:Uncharacterized protein n=1 Tax=Xenorhabdus bovienii str. Intermedium TaxID=1379677 RepID=A0A077QAH5_XENBV|nr:hypothetical protein XBI1_2450013 [Xenorhabdus bovienii str. Intermedium]
MTILYFCQTKLNQNLTSVILRIEHVRSARRKANSNREYTPNPQRNNAGRLPVG